MGAFLTNIYKNSKGGKPFLNLDINKYDKLNDVIDIIQSSYVDSVNHDALVDDAINGLLEKLDPHSTYITADELKEQNESLYGNFEGIGVEFRIEHDTVIVLNTISGGPSEKIGIRAGDRIVKVNDTVIAGIGISNEDVVKKLKGPKNTQVKVSVLRKSIPELLHFTITRDVIPSYSVDISYMVDTEIGYIKLNRFSATTYDEFKEATQNLKLKGMKKLIIDLRGNGGGYLNAAIDIADEFLEKKKLIVYTEGVKRSRHYEYAKSKGGLIHTPFIMILDEWSASASEVLAGALQDNDMGVVIGNRSFGKGLVQEQIDLPDGSAIRLTVARYYTPSGRCIQRSYDNSEDYFFDFYKRIVETDDSIAENPSDTEKFYTTAGRVVYGGGGITPDLIVKRTKYNEYINMLSNKGLIYTFCFEYADNNRNTLIKNFKTASEYNGKYQIDNELFQNFISFASKNGIKASAREVQESAAIIKAEMKAYIGRNLFSNRGFYPNIHKIDETFNKAIEILKDNALYQSLQSGNAQKN